MDYGALIERAFRITWNHRYLWVLGLLAGSGAGTCSVGGSIPTPDASNAPPGSTAPQAPLGADPIAAAGEAATQLAAVLAQYWLVVLVGVAVAALVAFGFWIISINAQAGLISVVAQIEAGQRSSLGIAWRSGTRVFWRFLGLWLLTIALAIATVIALAAIAVTIYFALLSSSNGSLAIVLVSLLLSLVVGVAMIPLAVVVSLTLVFGQRAIAIDGQLPIGAIGRGWSVLCARIGDVLIVWLISAGLFMASAAAVLTLLLIPAVPLLSFVVSRVVAGDLSPTSITAALTGSVFLVLMAVALAAPVNTFFWTYWTLVYLRLTGR